MINEKDISIKNIFLCSFGTIDLKKDKERFLKQALGLNIFKDIYIYNFSDLDEDIKKFIKVTSADKLKKKGYEHGYFVWKPHIIKKTLDKIPEDSILLYADLGCVLNIKGKETLYSYINYCQKYSCVGFQYRLPNKSNLNTLNYKSQKYYEYNYTKKEVFNYFNITKNHEIYNSEQIWAGSFLIKKNKTIKSFLQDWIDASQIHLLNKEFSIHENVELKEPRSDQSIFSILFKKYNFKSLCASEEVEWILLNNKNDYLKKSFEHLSFKPIQAKRSITKKKSIWRKLEYYVIQKLQNLNFIKKHKRRI